MSGNCNNTNPLQLTGTSQAGRVLAALDPGSAPIDGRQTYDWILFAKEYARYLQYYNTLGITNGDWQALMQGDISAVLATMAAQSMTLYQNYQSGLYNQLMDLAEGPQAETQAPQLLEAMFDLLFSWVHLVDQQYRLLPTGSSQQVMMGSLIQANLSVPLYFLSSYYKAVSTSPNILVAPVSTTAGIEVIAPLTLTISPAEGFSLIGHPPNAIWSVSNTLIIPPIPLGGGGTLLDQIRTLITSNVFNSVVDSLLTGVGSIATYANNTLESTLTTYNSHTPHYALFLTFLQLFQQSINHLNQFTGSHLNFYYNTVLGLNMQGPIGDQVHLVVTLQKNVPYLIIPQGTAVQAGKNASGTSIYYETTQAYTINQGQVAGLSSIQTLPASDLTYGAYTTVYESPTANSADGDGAPLTSPDGSWAPFGNLQTIKETASLGMAIASRDLYLREGQRTITVTFYVNGKIAVPTTVLQSAFQIQVTGAKGWITASGLTVTNAYGYLQYSFTLDGSNPAVVAYSPSIHKGSFTTSLPMIQFLLNMQAGSYNPMYAINQAGLNSINISTQVLGAKQIVVSTDNGPVDPSKPFMPFGATPHLGSAWTIANKEAFTKNLSNLTLLVEWDKIPAVGLDIYEDTNYPIADATGKLRHRIHQAEVAFLNAGIWVNDQPRGLFTGNELFTSYLYPATWLRNEEKYSQLPGTGAPTWQSSYDAIPLPLDQYSPTIFDDMTDDPYSSTSVSGYSRLTLAGDDFGYDDYLNSILNVTVTSNTSGSTTTQTISRVQPPYTPVIKSLMLSYNSSATQNFAPGNSTFFYLLPFGFQQSATPATVLPAFANKGELYIGLSGMTGNQTLSLLVQVSEGSGNPLENPPAVVWSYLSASNNWTALDPKTQIQDATNGLLQSGLVILTLPADLGLNAPLMGGSNAWVRAAVTSDVDAICNIISIQAQGILAAFADYAGTGVTYSAPVPASTISKWVKGNPSVKTLAQPYSSFGGQGAETSTQFSTRVSERLRHKARAISIWDYEHLVLQQFPQLYKVKCLNHTCYTPESDSSPERFNEGLPGHVTLVTIPNIINQNAVDPYTPYTSLGLLSDISDYLATVVSPFVQLHMANPQFEGVQFDVCVKFLQGYDPTAYGNQLNQAISQFLSPWAYTATEDIDFGGTLAKSVVLKFIEDLPYVDYVTCIQMNQYITATNVLYDLDLATASTSRSILVSYYNPLTGAAHSINPLSNDLTTCDCS
jgi:hypothetical protein